MNFSIITLGCKVNEYESQYYEEQMLQAGFEKALPGDNADVVIINTCTVTNTAAAKSRRKIRRARRENPGAFIAVVGCYAQMEEEEVRDTLEADLIIGKSGKKLLSEKVREGLESHARIDLTQIEDDSFEAMPIRRFEGQHRAFLKVQDGCNQYCSYCQIPLARGHERCADGLEIVRTARELAGSGHLEIVLTGIHTGRYVDEAHHLDLTGLLALLLENTPEDVCYRISSIEITEVSDALLDLMAQNRRVLPHLHIPIQAGSDGVLARMKRPYTTAQFKKRLAEIRKKVPDIAVSTDVITGFVQESDEEFAQTVQTLKDCRFSFLHVFPYSRRKGTAADAMTGFVDGNTVAMRTAALLELSDKLRVQDMETLMESGAPMDVLIEREDPRNPGRYLGYCRQYHPVSVISDTALQGRVRIRPERIENGVFQAVQE